MRDEALSRTRAWQRATIQRSVKPYVSEMRLWVKLHAIGILSGRILTATPLDALTFIGFFRNADSAAKYLTAVRWFYTYLGRAVSWESSSLSQALKGGHKLELLKKKIKGSIRWSLLERMVQLEWAKSEFFIALAYVLAAMFLMRCKNELVPLCWEAVDFETPAHAKPVVKLTFDSRKNLPAGTQLSRRCACPRHESICPVHIFSRVLKAARVRARKGKIFNFSYDFLLRRMRACLSELGVSNVADYSTKAFRRGTAQQMLENGSTLSEVCCAAQWNSKAFRFYLDQNAVDELAIFNAMDDASDDDEPLPRKRRHP